MVHNSAGPTCHCRPTSISGDCHESADDEFSFLILFIYLFIYYQSNHIRGACIVTGSDDAAHRSWPSLVVAFPAGCFWKEATTTLAVVGSVAWGCAEGREGSLPMGAGSIIQTLALGLSDKGVLDSIFFGFRHYITFIYIW